MIKLNLISKRLILNGLLIIVMRPVSATENLMMVPVLQRTVSEVCDHLLQISQKTDLGRRDDVLAIDGDLTLAEWLEKVPEDQYANMVRERAEVELKLKEVARLRDEIEVLSLRIEEIQKNLHSHWFKLQSVWTNFKTWKWFEKGVIAQEQVKLTQAQAQIREFEAQILKLEPDFLTSRRSTLDASIASIFSCTRGCLRITQPAKDAYYRLKFFGSIYGQRKVGEVLALTRTLDSVVDIYKKARAFHSGSYRNTASLVSTSIFSKVPFETLESVYRFFHGSSLYSSYHKLPLTTITVQNKKADSPEEVYELYSRFTNNDQVSGKQALFLTEMALKYKRDPEDLIRLYLETLNTYDERIKNSRVPGLISIHLATSRPIDDLINDYEMIVNSNKLYKNDHAMTLLGIVSRPSTQNWSIANVLNLYDRFLDLRVSESAALMTLYSTITGLQPAEVLAIVSYLKDQRPVESDDALPLAFAAIGQIANDLSGIQKRENNDDERPSFTSTSSQADDPHFIFLSSIVSNWTIFLSITPDMGPDATTGDHLSLSLGDQMTSVMETISQTASAAATEAASAPTSDNSASSFQVDTSSSSVSVDTGSY